MIMKLLNILLLTLTVFALGCGSDTPMTAVNTDEMEEENTALFRRGTFAPTPDIGKEAMGSATLNTLSSAMLRVEFSQDFSVTDGPGLFVYLSNAEFPTSDAINLGSFLTPMGAQNYSVPDGVSLDTFTHVLIHCVPYNVTFAFAELK